jgi:hypothetical protein
MGSKMKNVNLRRKCKKRKTDKERNERKGEMEILVLFTFGKFILPISFPIYFFMQYSTLQYM